MLYKTSANKFGRKICFKIEIKIKSVKPQTTRNLTSLFYTSGINLVILASTDGELWCGQAQNGINLDFEVKFDLEGQNKCHLNQGVLYIPIWWS